MAFALVGGWAIANYDMIRRIKGAGIEMERFQGEVATITDDALRTIKSQVEAHRQSIELLVAVANETQKKLGDQKDAVEKVIATARELGSKMEDQNRTVAEASRVATEAQKISTELSQKTESATAGLKTLESAMSKAEVAMARFREYAEFNDTVRAAQQDDRYAYDRLFTWSSNPAYPFRHEAIRAYQSILDAGEKMMREVFTITWREGINPETLSLQMILDQFRTADRNSRLGFIEYVWQRQSLSKKEKMTFLAEVLKTDPSLRVCETAGLYFKDGSSQNAKALAIPVHLEWWAINGDSIK